jgi:hypothetical protein
MIMGNSQIPDRRTLQLRGGSTSPWGQTHNRVLISDAPLPPTVSADAQTAWAGVPGHMPPRCHRTAINS